MNAKRIAKASWKTIVQLAVAFALVTLVAVLAVLVENIGLWETARLVLMAAGVALIFYWNYQDERQ